MIGPVRWARTGEANVAYRIVGDGPVDLVFLGGVMSHVEVMLEEPGIRRWFERLGSIARTVIVDPLGAGLSDPTPDWSEVREAEALLAVLDDAGLERVVVLGYGAATPSAVEFAAAHSDRVLGLILYAPILRVPPHEVAARADEGYRSWGSQIAETWGDGRSLGLLAPSAQRVPRLRDWLGRMERLSMTPAGLHRLVEGLHRIDVRERLTEIRAPTLVLFRQGDRFTDRKQAEYVAETIEDARLVVLPGDDSLPMVGETEPMLAEVEEFLTGKRSGAEADRALLTLVITDVVEATSRLARLGDGRWRDLLAAHDQVIKRQVDRFDGRVVKTVGDSFVVAFDGLPSVAVDAAREMVAVTKSLGVDIRVGVHTGECELIDNDIGGLAVHVTSRICDLAGPGEVLASVSTYGATIGSGVRFVARGSHELKGVPDSWPLYALETVSAV